MTLPLTQNKIEELLSKNDEFIIKNDFKLYNILLNTLNTIIKEKRSNINPISLRYKNQLSRLNDLSTREKLKVLEDISLATPYNTEYKNIKLLLGDLIIFKYGVSAIVDDTDKMKNYLIKYNDNEYNKMEILHEASILYYLNEYKTRIPNFVYIFRHFTCKPPRNISTDKRSICNSEAYRGTPFIILNKIEGKSLGEYIIGIPNIKKLLNYYLQILFSLHTVNTVNYFSHNDLHTGNIILKPAKDTIINYKLNNKIYAIKTNKIATIIDFGLSYISKKPSTDAKLSTLNSALTRYGIYTTHPNKASDAYKIIMFIGNNIYFTYSHEKNQERRNKLKKVLSDLEPIISFFTTIKNSKSIDDLLLFFKENQKSYYAFPSIDSYTHSKLIHYIIEKYDLPFLSSSLSDSENKNEEQITIPEISNQINSISDLFYAVRTRKISLEELNTIRKTFKSKLQISIKEELKEIEILNIMITDYFVSIKSYVTSDHLKELEDIKKNVHIVYEDYKLKLFNIVYEDYKLKFINILNKYNYIVHKHDANIYASYYINNKVSKLFLDNTIHINNITKIVDNIGNLGKNSSYILKTITGFYSINNNVFLIYKHEEKNNIQLQIETAAIEKNTNKIEKLIKLYFNHNLRTLDFIIYSYL